MQLFKCSTVNQFKICRWLAEQGLEKDDIAGVEFPDADTVKITNPAGQYMVIHWRDGQAEIDQIRQMYGTSPMCKREEVRE